MTGAEIKEARLAKGLTLKQLGDAIGKSAPFLHDLERDNRNASRATQKALIKALDLPYWVCPQCGVGFVRKEKK